MLKKLVLFSIAAALVGILAMSPSATMHSQESRHVSIAAVVPAALVIEQSPQRKIVPYADGQAVGGFSGTGDNSAGGWTAE
jgi:hypothetical protein